MMETTEEKIPINIELSEEEKKMCNASYNEVLLFYLVNPTVFLSHVYDSVSTMEWKFYF